MARPINIKKNSGMTILLARSTPDEMPAFMIQKVMSTASTCQPMLPKWPLISAKYAAESPSNIAPVTEPARKRRIQPQMTV